MIGTEVVCWEENPDEYVIHKGRIVERVNAKEVMIQFIPWEWDDCCKYPLSRENLSDFAMLTPELTEVLNELKAIYEDPWGLDPFEIRRDELWPKAEHLCKIQIDTEKFN